MKTLVLGATTRADRYANRAVRSLRQHGYDVVAVGKDEGTIGDVEILSGQPELENIHTITLYLNPANQKPLYDYIVKLKPERIIFNPGTENPELVEMAHENGIKPVRGCTLVMLATQTYEER